MYSNLYNYNKEPCQVSVRTHIIEKTIVILTLHTYYQRTLNLTKSLNLFIRKKKGSLKI